MQETLLSHGYRLVEWSGPADVRIVNTCTVTAKSDRTCRHEIRLAKRLDPACVVAVTGCYAQVDPAAVAAIPGVDLVLGNLEKQRLSEHLDKALGTRRATGSPAAIAVSPYSDHQGFEGEFFTHFYGYTRAFLKIQTGCDSRCAYCVIPLARGPARSMPRSEVLAQAQLLAARGYREVVLTGINLGSWGRDTGEGSLATLVDDLMHDGEVGRYRLSSIEPLETDEALQESVLRAGSRVAHHFHLPLQSGSDPVLQRMNRPYTAAQYLDVVQTISRRFPDAALGADIIAGFPGETDREFEETISFVEHSPLTYLHVFSYSDRPGTQAAQMAGKVRPETVHERSLRLRALGERKKEAFHRRLAGTEQRVLVLRERTPEGRLVGLSGNYLEVMLSGSDDLTNHFALVRLEGFDADGRAEGTLLACE
jgi:threonylcarbamoyladenosine tRNA methylthiotransferase MtaB